MIHETQCSNRSLCPTSVVPVAVYVRELESAPYLTMEEDEVGSLGVRLPCPVCKTVQRWWIKKADLNYVTGLFEHRQELFI